MKLILIPTYNNFAYVFECLRSLIKYSHDYKIAVIDDCSPDWTDSVEARIRKIVPPDCLILERYSEGGGNLTRSWNRACELAKEHKCKYTVLANDDVKFSPFWWENLESALEKVDLVAPVTNAPGGKHYDQQRVNTYIKDYVLSDKDEDIMNTAMSLQEFKGQVCSGRVNGFFFAAKTSVLWNSSYNGTTVFDPSKKLLGAEDEYMDRFPGKMGTALSSFIFHYRSVSRGIDNIPVEFLRGMHRMKDEFDGKVVVYTAIFNDWDRCTFKDLPTTADYVLFTDKHQNIPGVDVKVRKSEGRKTARYYKCNPHKELPEYDAWIWLDGNMQLKADPQRVISEMLATVDHAALKHPSRCCAYQEAVTIKNMRLGGKDVDTQMEQYVKDGFPVVYGLYETGIFLRKNTPKIVSFNETWWEQIEKHTNRDQLSVMYALWKNKMNPVYISGSSQSNQIAHMHPHHKISLETVITYG